MNWKKALLISLGVLVVTFGIGYLVATRILFPPLPEPEPGIAVPNLAGTNLREVDSRLRTLGLNLSDDQLRIAHPSQPPGIVIAQDPLPGQQLRPRGVVRVGVSAGLPRVQVPNVIGFDVERATAVLSQMGLAADQRSEQNSRPIGTVLGIRPEPGQSQPVPGRVLLIVSAGPPPEPPPAAPSDSVMRADSLVSTTND